MPIQWEETTWSTPRYIYSTDANIKMCLAVTPGFFYYIICVIDCSLIEIQALREDDQFDNKKKLLLNQYPNYLRLHLDTYKCCSATAWTIYSFFGKNGYSANGKTHMAADFHNKHTGRTAREFKVHPSHIRKIVELVMKCVNVHMN